MKTYLSCAMLFLFGGCASAPTQPPGLPPTPASVTRSNPGGDADDPEDAAVQRLLERPFELRKDRFNTLRVSLPDGKLWRRVRIWGHPMRAAFQYGDDHYGAMVFRYTPAKENDTPANCLDDFMKYASKTATEYGVRYVEKKNLQFQPDPSKNLNPVVGKVIEGSLEGFTSSDEYYAAVVSYSSWPGTCLVSALAIAADEGDSAMRVIDRWLSEGATNVTWTKKVKEAPVFKDR